MDYGSMRTQFYRPMYRFGSVDLSLCCVEEEAGGCYPLLFRLN